MLSKSQLTEYAELLEAMAKHNQAFDIARLAIDLGYKIIDSKKRYELEISISYPGKIQSKTFIAKSKKEAIKKAIEYYS